MTKQDLESRINELKEEYELLGKDLDAVRAKYDRPSQWTRDPKFVEIGFARIELLKKMEQLRKQLGRIEDREYFDRIAAS